MQPGDLPDGVREPLDRWLAEVVAARIPASARAFAPDLHRELCRAVAAGTPPPDALARDWRSQTGTDRRGRSLRTLDRLGFLDAALEAVREARDRLGPRR